MKFKDVTWPDWPVENALAKLEDMIKIFEEGSDNKDFTITQEEYRERAATLMRFMTHVINGINDQQKPQPVDPRIVLQKAISRIFNSAADALENVASSIRDIDTWEFRRDE